MKNIKFDGILNIEQVMSEYQSEIYDSIISSIKENYRNIEISEILVVKISTKETDYSINLSRSKFKLWIDKIIIFFESIEEYEKCQECIIIKNDIEEMKKQII